MKPQTAPVFLISGPPGAGKTTVAVELAQRFPFGMHLPVDDLREWVVSGIAGPLPEWTDETTRQFSLARRAAAQVARIYSEAGFAVTLADVILRTDTERDYDARFAGLPVVKVVLLPRLEVALNRNATRTNKTFDTAILNETIRDLHKWMRTSDYGSDGWIEIDNSDQTVAETVMQILEAAGYGG